MSPAALIIGAGGHGRVVADALLAAGEPVVGFLDQNPTIHGAHFLGVPVLGGDELLASADFASCLLVNGIVGAEPGGLRRATQERLEAAGHRFRGVRHPGSVLSPWALIAEDAQLLAGSIVQAGARLGPGCIINTRAVVEHDCRLEAYVHCAPGAVLCGDVTAGEGTHIGAGSVVRQGLSLGPRTIIGAGAAVVTSHTGRVVLLGVPARPQISRHDPG